MHFRNALAAFVATSIGLCGAANAQAPMPASVPPPAPTPITGFSDVAGQWWGAVDLYTPVLLTISPDGLLTLRGVRRLTQQGVINGQRIEVVSTDTDLYCTLMNEKLTCNARFGTWYASLNLHKSR